MPKIKALAESINAYIAMNEKKELTAKQQEVVIKAREEIFKSLETSSGNEISKKKLKKLEERLDKIFNEVIDIFSDNGNPEIQETMEANAANTEKDVKKIEKAGPKKDAKNQKDQKKIKKIKDKKSKNIKDPKKDKTDKKVAPESFNQESVMELLAHLNIKSDAQGIALLTVINILENINKTLKKLINNK